jgi:hypothetical protein
MEFITNRPPKSGQRLKASRAREVRARQASLAAAEDSIAKEEAEEAQLLGDGQIRLM